MSISIRMRMHMYVRYPLITNIHVYTVLYDLYVQ